jgi:LysM repeat protein
MLNLNCTNDDRGDIMKTNKLGTIILILIMVFAVTFAAGCESKEDPKTDPGTVEPEPGKTDPTPEPTPEKPKVKLLKRNGVEWKENTKINSYVGAKQYKVVWGDTLSLIARTWKVNCYRLARYNGIKNIDLIEVDQIIKNPAAK